ncbi:IclR family transcriptional regulator [Sodalis ligni]|uniref:HTH-type transcriptional repressor AllR n=1 Tax=Sodalis ligni TaxID=2697027 RepID=A0A4R1NEB8_9GAMM|nr:IclR family transcriptional regulator [Sodalis ligni]TCL05964.1 IclR family transcriptional regulator [Sodalis ligni]
MNEVKSAVRVLEVLELLTHEEKPLSLKEVVDELGYPKSSTHNLLATLVSRGYAIRDETDRYQLNNAFREGPGWICGPEARLSEMALPVMRELRDRCGETIMLGVLNGEGRLKTLERCSGTQPVRYESPLGSCLPSYCTAMGRALLAGRDDAQIDNYLSRERIVQYTRHTLVDREQIKAHIAKARRDGYAVSDQEIDIGGSGVAAPVLNGKGETVAALNVAAISSRFNENGEALIAAVKNYAAILSSRLGWH